MTGYAVSEAALSEWRRRLRQVIENVAIPFGFEPKTYSLEGCINPLISQMPAAYLAQAGVDAFACTLLA
jgi:hypothetical protein